MKDNEKQDQPNSEFKSGVYGIDSPEDTRRFLAWYDSLGDNPVDENGWVEIPVWSPKRTSKNN